MRFTKRPGTTARRRRLAPAGVLMISLASATSAAKNPGGADCHRDHDCESGECSGVFKNRKCTYPKHSLKGGTHCKRNEECESGQCSGLGDDRKCTHVKGTLKNGNHCKRNEECESGQCSGLGDNRECTAKAGTLNPGQDCRRNEECKSGECRGVGSKRECTALSGTLEHGAKCQLDKECKSGQCTGVGSDRACTAKAGSLAHGAKCSRNEECQSGQCSGLGSGRECTAKAGTLEPGQSCQRNEECKSGQCSGLGSQRKCEAMSKGKVKTGDHCSRDDDCQSGECSGLLKNRKCSAAPGSLAAGAECDRNGECKSGQCSGLGDNRKCTAEAGKLGMGAKCRRNPECQSGQCSGLGDDRKCTAEAGRLEVGKTCKRNEECKSGECAGTGDERWCTAETGTSTMVVPCKLDKECKSGECHRGLCTAMTGSLLAGDECVINKECKYGRCDSISDLTYDYCIFGGAPCQDGQKKPEFPLRSSTTKNGVHVRWLGTGGYEVSIDEMRIIIDPFMARPWKHVNRGRTIKAAAILNTLNPFSLSESASPTGSKYLAYYDGINRADWVFVTHGHADHSAEAGALLLNLAKRYHQQGKKLEVGVVGDDNMMWLLNGYEAQHGLSKTWGAKIRRENLPKSPTGGQKIALGNGVQATVYAAHHSRGEADHHGWGHRSPNERPPLAPELDIASYKAWGVYNLLIEAKGKRILFLASSDIDLVKDTLPTGDVDVMVLSIPSWNTGNRDARLGIIGRMNPAVLVPSHFDDYFWEWREGCFVSEYANLPKFLREFPKIIASSKDKSGNKVRTRMKLLDYAESLEVK
jgi:L-ascorbate metabolism protein UlaG (beta-lactamase superfamily)